MEELDGILIPTLPPSEAEREAAEAEVVSYELESPMLY